MGSTDLENGLEGHNASKQIGVELNPDPALDYANEHRHRHPHHFGTSRIIKDQTDDIMYATDAATRGGDREHVAARNSGTTTEGEKAIDRDSSNRHSLRNGDTAEVTPSGFKRYYRKIRPFVPILVWFVFTAWWIFGLVTVVVWKRTDGLSWLIPFLLYLAITIRVLTLYVPVSIFWNPVIVVWSYTGVKLHSVIPGRLRQPIAAIITIAVFLIGSLVPAETGDNTRANRGVSIFGLIVMLFGLWITSRDRKAIPWHTVIGGMFSQFVIAIFVLRSQVGYDIFSFISFLARTLLTYASAGVIFLTDDTVPDLGWFITGVLPPVIFFVSLISLLFYTGILQWFIVKFAGFFFWTLRVSGAEAVVAAATPFIGQGESAMLIRPFVPHLTRAEIHQIMTCGFATISGSVLAAYINLGLNPQALVSSCIMSIPASLAISKMRYPESEETLTSGRIVVPDDSEHQASNAIHAFANGAWLGLKIAGMIMTTLLCILAFVAFINGVLGWWGKYFNILDPVLSLELILGYVLYPVAWLLGVPNQDLEKVASIIGLKIVSNEFVAFTALAAEEDLTTRGRIIATYACCGFGNIGSLGNQIGVLSQIAPGRIGDISKVAVSALISGIIATLSSASIAGMLFTDTI